MDDHNHDDHIHNKDIEAYDKLIKNDDDELMKYMIKKQLKNLLHTYEFQLEELDYDEQNLVLTMFGVPVKQDWLI